MELFDTHRIQKYLGMVVHFVYYHHQRLHLEQTFEDDYWDQLKHSSDKEYLENMYDCLTYALTQDDYCLSITNHPFQERYSESDIRLFFEKFHSYLGKCLKNYDLPEG